MRYSTEQLKRFWQAAQECFAVVVIGGGRWARVWIDVLAEARGSSKNLHIVARSAPESVKAWRDNDPALRDLAIWPSVADAFKHAPDIACTIIASRPKDHVDDAMDALSFKSHVLVEKPVGDCSARAQQLIEAGALHKRVVAVGTEFSFLTGFHFVASRFFPPGQSQRLKMELTWNDPLAEVRYGAAKSRHNETGLVFDLLPHAFSIFRIFSPASGVRLVDVDQSVDGQAGRIVMASASGHRLDFNCNLASTERTRVLAIKSEFHRVTVNFSNEPAAIETGGRNCSLDDEWATMNSTLRLELGAFFGATQSSPTNIPIVKDLGVLIELQASLEHHLSNKL